MRIAYRHPLTLAALLIGGAAAAVAGQPAVLESFRAQIALKSAGGPRISPDGRLIAYSVTTTEWEANRFDREIWLVAAGGEPIQLTRTQSGSSTGHRWSPDGSRLGFLADRGDGEQIYLIPPGGGEAVRLTSHDGGIRSFRFSPDGGRIAFAATDPAPDDFEGREESYGDYAVEDADFRMSHLWVTEVRAGAEPRRLTGGDGFTIGSFDWSPRRSRDRVRPHAHAPGQLISRRGHLGRRGGHGNGPDAGRGSRPRARADVVAGRCAHPLCHLGGREPLLREHRTRGDPGSRRRIPRSDRRFRRKPVPAGVERCRRLLRRFAAHRAPTVPAGSRVGRSDPRVGHPRDDHGGGRFGATALRWRSRARTAPPSPRSTASRAAPARRSGSPT